MDEVRSFCFGAAEPGGKIQELLQIVSCIHDNAQEHDEMVRSFVEKLGDAQLNLQVTFVYLLNFMNRRVSSLVSVRVSCV